MDTDTSVSNPIGSRKLTVKFYPIRLKATELLHRSEVNFVKNDISSGEELARRWIVEYVVFAIAIDADKYTPQRVAFELRGFSFLGFVDDSVRGASKYLQD